MTRVLRGKPAGEAAVTLTAVEQEAVGEDTLNCALTQFGDEITISSAFGVAYFFRPDTGAVVRSLRNLADFIERQVIQDVELPMEDLVPGDPGRPVDTPDRGPEGSGN